VTFPSRPLCYVTPRAQAETDALPDGKDGVYFARCGRHVKVGFSCNPPNRIERIRAFTATPFDFDWRADVELLRVIPGGRDQERQAHRALDDFLACGEWFAAEPSVLAYIDGLDGSGYPQMSRIGGPFEPYVPPVSPEVVALINRAMSRALSPHGKGEAEAQTAGAA